MIDEIMFLVHLKKRVETPEMPANFLGEDSIIIPITTVDGWNAANQLRLVVYPIIYKGFSTIPGGWLGFLNHQQYFLPQKSQNDF